MELSTEVGSDHCTVKIIIQIKPVKTEMKNNKKYMTTNKTKLENVSKSINKSKLD